MEKVRNFFLEKYWEKYSKENANKDLKKDIKKNKEEFIKKYLEELFVMICNLFLTYHIYKILYGFVFG